MLKRLVISILACTTGILLVDGSKLNLEDMESITISLLPESESPLQVSDKDKPILRYGFHRTYDCQNFEKAFICVRKCLDLNYQIAHADKTCNCTCYKNSILAKYKAPFDSAAPKWKLGAPTTTKPAWAGAPEEKKPLNYEIGANYTEFNEDNKDLLEKAEVVETTAAGEGGDGSTPPGEGAPGDGEGSGNAGEAATEEAPAEGEEAPADAEAAPAGEEAAPAEGDAAPAEGGDAPAEGDAAPAEEEAAPAPEEPAPEE